MAQDLQELYNLVDLLKLEKEEDFEQFKVVIQNLSLSEKRKKGYTWYPLNLVKSGYTIGDRAFVVVEKTTDTIQHHRFRAGKTVNFYSQQAGAYQPEKTGIINFVDKNKMKIVLNTKDLPDWISLGQIGVDLLFDERTYLEMEKALKKVIEAKSNRLAELRSIILGKQEALFNPLTYPISIPQLNTSQNEAVNTILAARDIAIIHGPPGTGKTTTLVYAIKKLVESEHTILVCAPSNAAVDLLTERLSSLDLNVVRIGNISRVDESIIQHTLENRLSKHPESKNIKKIKIQAAEARRNANKFKRRFGAQERQERKDLYKEARELTDWANQLEDRMVDHILSAAQVITCTFVGSSNRILEKLKFKTVVIDEAAQALEPANWIPITKASKVVLAGDPFQLPPTVKSNEAQRKGLNVTILEKSIERIEGVCLLNTQYRMHHTIMGFSNRQFYNNALIADESVKDQVLAISDNTPVTFIDTAGCGFEEQVNEEFMSKSNPDEFGILLEHLYLLVQEFEEKTLASTAIISPYREQVIYMKKTIAEDDRLENQDILVDTIDAFQGQERDIVYISLVRSNAKGDIGFLNDYRRMNVAMTRAKKKLVIIGDSSTIGGNKFYDDFLEYAEVHGLYKSAWDYMQ